MRWTRLLGGALNARRPPRRAWRDGRDGVSWGKIGRTARVAKARSSAKSNACPPTEGRAAFAALVLLLVAGVVWLWLGAGSERIGPGPSTAPEPSHSPPVATPPVLLREAVRVPDQTSGGPEEPAQDERLEPFRGARTNAAEFIGPSVTVRGRVEVSGEEPFPEVWSLRLRPARFLPGRETAVPRVLDLTGAQREFELTDVPLGGYELVAEAEGFNGLPLPLLLEKGAASPFLVLHMVPAGLLEGRVIDAQGLPAEGVPLTLFPQSGGPLRESTTDAGGAFRFPKLPDGAYDLLVGKESAPLIRERRPVRFAAPRLTFPDIELPPLGELSVRVVDSLARPLEGVEVRGSGTNGGLVEGKTDYDGRLVARHLPAGHFRLRLEHPGFDSSYARRVTVEVRAGEVAEASVRLGP